jgi:hypothetical protein
MKSEETIGIQLGLDEALVLFELLAEFYDQAALDIPSHSEQLALVRLHGALESTLVEPLQPDYSEKLYSARQRLIDQFRGH